MNVNSARYEYDAVGGYPTDIMSYYQFYECSSLVNI